MCQNIAKTMEHLFEFKGANKIIGGISGVSENNEELMTISNYMGFF